MQEQEKSDSVKMKNALCFIPFVAFVFYFTESAKNERMRKNIRYAMIFLITYVLLSLVLRFVFIWILLLVYLWFSAFLWYKSSKGEDIDIEFIDNLFEKK